MRQISRLQSITDNLILVLAYYASGHLSMLFLTIPPSNATAIWPPAGISLAAVLIQGYRVLPAVFVGDLIIALEIFGFADKSAVTLSLMVGFQAFLSAWLGAYFIKSILGQLNPLVDNRSIMLFLLIGGPVSQIISAVLIIVVELSVSVIGYRDAVSSVFTWWLGSSIGVVIFTPLVFIFAAEPRELWRSRILPVAVPLVILCVCAVWIFDNVRVNEQKRMRQLFNYSVGILHQQVIDEKLALAELGEKIGMLVDRLNLEPENQLKIVSRALLKGHEEITAMAWIPIGGSIFETEGGGVNLDVIGSDSRYELFMKLNPNFVNQWRDMLIQVRDSGQFRLMSWNGAENKQSIPALVMPFYRYGNAPNTMHTAGRELSGYLALFFDHAELHQKAVANARRQQIKLDINDDGSEVAAPAEINFSETGIEKSISFNVWEKNWIYTYKAGADFLHSHAAFSYGWVSTAGFCIISLIGFILLSVTGHALQTQKLADDKVNQLNNEHRLFESILNNVREGIIAVDRKGRLTMLNRAAKEQYGFDRCDISSKTWSEHGQMFESDGRTRLASKHHPLNLALAGKEINAFEMLMQQGNLLRTFSVNSQPLRDQNERIIGAVASFQDVTCHKQYIDELKTLSLALEHSPSSVMITNTEGYIEYVNDKFEIMTGYTLKEISGKTPAILKSGRTPDTVYVDMWETLLAGKEWRGELLNKKKNGELYWSKQWISPVKNELGQITHFIATMEDVTELRKKNELIFYQASHDRLTGLLNRRECERRLKRIIKNCKTHHCRHVFCFLDLDKFKAVNDTCGHNAGDELLRAISKLLRKNLRRRDTLARLGGDEFGIILEHCLLPRAQEIAEVLCREVRQFDFYWQGHRFKIGVSIGLTEVNAGSGNFAAVIKEADKACYQVKKLGRGQVAVYDGSQST